MYFEDHFCGDDGCIHWIYFNPDAFSGAQFVEMTFDKDLLQEALDVNGGADIADSEDVYAYLEGNSEPVLYDEGQDGYEDIEFMYDHADRIGGTEKTLEWIIAYLK